MKTALLFTFGVFCIWTPAVSAATSETIPLKDLPPNSRLAIWGDSITETTLYPQFVETYLLACAGRKDVTVCTFGHSGERMGGLLSRQSDLDAFKPTVVSFNYGMNDTEYYVYSAAKGAAFDKTVREVLAMLAARHIEQRIAVGPDFVDDLFGRENPAAFFRGADPAGLTAAQGQNVTLHHFRDFNRAAAIDSGSAFADVHVRMADAYARAVKVMGPNYALGVHPFPNGHLLIAQELLKALACDGQIGTIDVDMQGGATASPGHKIVRSAGGEVVLESEKYPFCYHYDAMAANSPSNLASILPFTPFSQELNRLVLKVKNLDAASARSLGAAKPRRSPAKSSPGESILSSISRTRPSTPLSRMSWRRLPTSRVLRTT